MSNVVYTIGHSTHPIEHFVGLLCRHQVSAVADVRSSPYSRFNPQFNREVLKTTLNRAGIEYVFLGDELGARPMDPSCYIDGKARYELIANTSMFQCGLDRIAQGFQTHRIAIMCAEKEPLVCHRSILVSRHLTARGIKVHHILEGGELEGHAEAIARLRAELGLPDRDFFRSDNDIITEAYRLRGEQIAYIENAEAVRKEESGANR